STELVFDMDALVPFREPVRLVASGSRAFIHAQGAANDEIWVSDGTTAGTVFLRDLGANSDPRHFMASSTRLFWSARDGDELWTSDGTPAGTVMVRDFSPGTTLNAGALPLAIFQEQLIFSVREDIL